MCGIVGVINGSSVTNQLLSGLKNLEYRGYDSAGVATLGAGGLQRKRAEGKLSALAKALAAADIDGPAGIGHTRWATHGAPTRQNAHPHMTNGIAVVHNGIIENYRQLREELAQDGVLFSSETDSEVIPHLIARYRQAGGTALEATRETLSRLEGQFATAILFQDLPGTIYCARRESPLAIGYNDHETLIASDMLAFAGRAKEEMYLETGDLAVLQRNKVVVLDQEMNEVHRPWRESTSSAQSVALGAHDHFMHKEIHEQPEIITESVQRTDEWRSLMPDVPQALLTANHLSLVACGTSLYAGMIARSWFETYADMSVSTDFASEFRYRAHNARTGKVGLFISQSGETADTLACLRMYRAQDCATVAVVNAPRSAMAREACLAIPTHAGPEIGVASTKAFSAQLATLLRLAVELGVRRRVLSRKEANQVLDSLGGVAHQMKRLFAQEPAIRRIANKLKDSASALFVGRGDGYPLALEGALKLKEISYIHAEGFAAGELKHGPIALVDEAMPAIVLAPRDALFAKTASNAEEIAARGGQLILLSDRAGCEMLEGRNVITLPLPTVDEVQMPFVYGTALQLLAYYAAVARGTDVDQPRNLAKSVTVE